MSRLRASSAVRVASLEEKADERELQEGMHSPIQRAWDRAMALAPPDEIEELKLLCELAKTQEPKSSALLETHLNVWALKERIMRREAPTLAAFYRARRCMFLYGLQQLEEEAKQDYEGWYESPAPRFPPGTSGSQAAAEMRDEIDRRQRRYYGLVTAAINRKHAVGGGLEPITDLAEASRLIAEVLTAVDAPGGTDQVLRIVWQR